MNNSRRLHFSHARSPRAECLGSFNAPPLQFVTHGASIANLSSLATGNWGNPGNGV